VVFFFQSFIKFFTFYSIELKAKKVTLAIDEISTLRQKESLPTQLALAKNQKQIFLIQNGRLLQNLNRYPKVISFFHQ
jgi:hypothetical protein